MGTRADFYVGRGKDAEWLGSIAWDGYPDGIWESVKTATDDVSYRISVKAFLKDRDDATFIEDGWPWPWVDSNTTDYAYAFDKGRVWASPFGHPWFLATDVVPDEDENPQYWQTKGLDFPNMEEIQNVSFGNRSGLIVISHNSILLEE